MWSGLRVETAIEGSFWRCRNGSPSGKDVPDTMLMLRPATGVFWADKSPAYSRTRIPSNCFMRPSHVLSAKSDPAVTTEIQCESRNADERRLWSVRGRRGILADGDIAQDYPGIGEFNRGN